MVVQTEKPTRFPLYLLMPQWASGATVRFRKRTFTAQAGKYLLLDETWESGDSIVIHLPMMPRTKLWDQMKSCVSVEYGPLTFSLLIPESYRKVDGKSNSAGDSGWQPAADTSAWPTYEILPNGPWNYGLVQKPAFQVIHKAWPSNNYPFTLDSAPLEIRTRGRQIPSWTLDQNGLCAILPKSPVAVTTPLQELTLVPMGAARLRISSFPTVK